MTDTFDQLRPRHLIIPAAIFLLFALTYLIIAVWAPPERVLYCPNPDCHSTAVKKILPPSGARPLPNADWSYYRCGDCQAVFAGKATVDNLLTEPVWDIKHYASIAERGYERYDCDESKHWPHGDICGNVGWLPGWPLAVWALSLGHVSGGLTVFPFLFTLLGVVLFYNLVRRLHTEKAALIATLALVAAPTAFYFLTGFPYAFILVLFSAYLYYLYSKTARGRGIILPLLAVLLSLTYPSLVLAAVIPLVWLFNKYRRRVLTPSLGNILRDVGYYLLPFAVGPLALSLYFHVRFDDFLLFLHFQEKYDRQWGFPLTVIYKSLVASPQWETGLFMPPRLLYEKLALIYYGAILLCFPPYRIKSELWIFVIVFFLFSPTTGNIVSVYRHYIILFPAAMIIAASPRPVWFKALFVISGLILSFWWFYPFYLNGYLV